MKTEENAFRICLSVSMLRPLCQGFHPARTHTQREVSQAQMAARVESLVHSIQPTSEAQTNLMELEALSDSPLWERL